MPNTQRKLISKWILRRGRHPAPPPARGQEVGGGVRRREVARAKNTQLSITPAGAAPKTSVYEPVTSYKERATVGPSAAPRRQPRASTPMIAPRARIPNTSGMTFTVIVSAAAKPIPNATSDAERPPGDG